MKSLLPNFARQTKGVRTGCSLQKVNGEPRQREEK